MKKAKKKATKKKAIKAKIVPPAKMAAMIMELQAANNLLVRRLEIAEAQIENLLSRALKNPIPPWPNVPYVSPSWPYQYMVTEVVEK